MAAEAWLLAGLLAAAAARWTGLARRFRAEAARQPVLRPAPWPAGQAAPLVTIVLPARDEAHQVAACVEALLAQRYPALEVVAVDDRSADGTRAILHGLAAADPRLRVVAGAELPAGWAGKNWANHQGARLARGAWLLFTDADVVLHPDALATAMAQALPHPDDLLTLSPRLVCRGPWERAVQPALVLAICTWHPLARREDPAHPDALANGQFLLFARAAYVGLGGHGAIAPELLDDLALAARTKAAGRRVRYLVGRELVAVRMYDGLGALWRGWRKAFVAPAPLLAVHAAWELAGGVLPFLALPWIGHPAVALAAAWALAALAAARTALLPRFFDRPGRWLPLHPLGALVLAGIIADGQWRGFRGLGADWKGRTYG